MVNSFLTFENDYYSGHNGIRHSRGTGAYAEVNQDPGEQCKGAESRRPFGSRISPDKNWLTVAMGRTSDRRGAHVQG